MAPEGTVLRTLRPRTTPPPLRQTIGSGSPECSKDNANVAPDDDARASLDAAKGPNPNLPYHRFFAGVTDTDPRPGRKTSKFVNEQLAAITTPDRTLVAEKTIANLPLIKRATRAVARSRPESAVPTQNLGKARRYEETLDAAWGGRAWLPPPLFSRIRPGKIGRAETKLLINSLSYMATLARLCREADIDVRTWYDEGGLLREAAVLCHGQPIRWTKAVPKRAVQLLRERGGAIPSASQDQNRQSTANDEVARHAAAAAADHSSDDESLGSTSMNLATNPLGQVYSSPLYGPNQVSVIHHEYIRASTVSSMQDCDYDDDFSNFDTDDDEPPFANIGNDGDSVESVMEVADAVQDDDAESAAEANHVVGDSPVGNSSEEANIPILENLPIAFKTLPKAVNQLSNRDRLTDDSIQVLQLVLLNSMVPEPRILVVDPLYLQPAGRLPARLPSTLQSRRKDRIVTVVHQRRLQHWILLDICFADRYVRSYDSISSSGASPDVKEAVVPWLSLHRCPQQDDDTSCGAFALLGMQHLLAGNLTLADLDVKSGKHARETLLRTALAKPPIHSKVPHCLVQVSTGLPPPQTQSPATVPRPPQPRARSVGAAEALGTLTKALSNERTLQAEAESSYKKMEKWAESVLQASSQITQRGAEHSDTTSCRDAFQKTKEAHQLFVENSICRAKMEVDAADKKVQEAEDAVAEQRQVVVTAEQGVIDAETLLGNAELSLRNYQDYKKLQGALAA
uniref:Ubiquitin-like protease family profile domain-containing protein n=2 Tax=Colletotrichum fructicola (strain Nara gc5) TaxID=1213859 RepID=L2F9X2_COLFN